VVGLELAARYVRWGSLALRSGYNSPAKAAKPEIVEV
jgi:hypothetical protein